MALQVAFLMLFLMLPSTVMAARGTPRISCPSFSPVLAFGDSTTDTGNAIISVTASVYSEATRLPYGTTFFHQPTGRFSDGRLMVDHLMEALNIPFLQPHLSAFSPSAENFAVAGATALDVATLQQLAPGAISTTPDSLGMQLDWFKKDTANLDLHDALIYLGEIGGNDYNYALAATRDPAQVASLIQPVISKISSFLEDLLNANVKRVVIQGEFPMGCLPLYLTTLSNLPKDAHGCVEAVMALSDQHNQLLKQAVVDASTNHPDAQLVFLDTSAAYLHILDSASSYGFSNVVDACFPGGLLAGLISNGHAGATVCSNPQNYISWDGIHMTDAMYGAMMNLFLTNEQFFSPSASFLVTAAELCN